mgnify:CR=1 FL=1
MPKIYLSPSLQEFNKYLSGGSEEEYMNLVADAMIPYLEASGIEYTRNRPDMTLTEVINESNSDNYDLHLALHSNASPESLAGKLRGTDVYYWYTSVPGEFFADILAENFKDIYPNPEAVKAVPTNTLRELRRTFAPAVLIEIAYHDNPEDEKFIKENIDEIAKTIVRALTEYFGIPFVEPKKS